MKSQQMKRQNSGLSVYFFNVGFGIATHQLRLSLEEEESRINAQE